VRAYLGPGCCLPTSATEHDVRALSTGLSIPRTDDGQDHLPSLTHHADLFEKSGDTWRAAHSSEGYDPGVGSLPLSRACPTRYRNRRVTSRFRGSSVTIDVHGSLDRVKDVSCFEQGLVGHQLEQCVRFAHADDVPLLLLPEDTRCRRCACPPGNEPQTDMDRPTEIRPAPKAREG
jgi:hypothetical protein